MAIVTYKHPVTGAMRKFDDSDSVRLAAVEKLGFEKWTAADVKGEEALGVTFEPVAQGTPASDPPALPKLTKPIPPGPTRDTSPTAPPITMSTNPDEVESKGKK